MHNNYQYTFNKSKVWYWPTCNPTLHEYLGVGAKHHAHQQEKHSEK